MGMYDPPTIGRMEEIAPGIFCDRTMFLDHVNMVQIAALTEQADKAFRSLYNIAT